MPRSELKVEILRNTLDSELVVALAAKLCYAGGDLDSLREKIEKKDQEKFIRQLTEMGHLSVLEHASFTFLVEGVSRSLLAQLTRHRIASFSVQSQRYVSYDGGFSYVVPPAIEALGAEAVEEYEREMAEMQSWYLAWQEKLGGKGEKANEDARFVLPNACTTRLMVTMNVRELLHFFALRSCSRAQWEIRALARKMLAECYAVCPALFENAGPDCVRGKCSEGAKTCGRAAETRAEIAALKMGKAD
ncbi:MAG: FAD-dependent thymidylate synthase [Eubacteriales bacterium]|nr:FAD-dependent thymidylate synthase [Eubacteriales bacterium]MDD3881390.1 FAD-dependent thymidylate synthase [Eubacteriales bacterium]MDD4513077.1 FAD-dependent thymidylate synthase [Eubacteriales bacterium]